MRFILALAVVYVTTGQSFASATPPIEIAITIDDLPSHGPLPKGESRLDIAKKMLQILKRHKVGEVFGFINAEKSEKEPETFGVLKEWIANGYPLGNHTFSHLSLNEVSAADFLENIDKNEPVLRALSLNGNYKWFRYPFLHEGNTLEKRNSIREHLAKTGYKIAQVTIDFEDWMWNAPYVRCQEKGDKGKIEWLKQVYLQSALNQLERSAALSNILFHRPIKHILLLHIGAFDAVMLDKLLSEFEKKGVRFISLAAANEDRAYRIDSRMAPGWDFLDRIMRDEGKKLPRSPELPFDEVKHACR